MVSCGLNEADFIWGMVAGAVLLAFVQSWLVPMLEHWKRLRR